MPTYASLKKVFPLFITAVLSLWLLQIFLQGIGLQQQVLLTVLAVLVLGMPHGALDVLMINKFAVNMQVSRNLPAIVVTVLIWLVYTALTGLAFLAWLKWPMFCLSLFLIISAIHFAPDWEGFDNKLMTYAFGVAVVTLPTLRYAQEVSFFFSELNLNVDNADTVVIAMKGALLLASICIIAILFRTLHKKMLIFTVAVLFIAGLALPPLLYFIAYFCALHSVMHTLSVKYECQVAWGDLMRALVLPMGGTLLLLFAAYMFTPAQTDMARWLHLVFIGLFALTVPHMILTLMHKRFQK